MKSCRDFILSRFNNSVVDELFKSNRLFAGNYFYWEDYFIHFGANFYYSFKYEGIKFLIREEVKLKCDWDGVFKGSNENVISSISQVNSTTSLFAEFNIERSGSEEDFNFLKKNIMLDDIRSSITNKLEKEKVKLVKKGNVKLEYNEERGFIIPDKIDRFLDF